MGFNVNRNLFTDYYFKSRESANLLKEKLIFYLCKIINDENSPEGFDQENCLPEDFMAVA